MFPSEHIVIFSVGVVALAIAKAIGFFRARTVIGPDRADAPVAQALFIVTLCAFSAWLLVPALFVGPVEATIPATVPATTPAATFDQLSPASRIAAGLLGGTAALLVLLVGDSVIRPRGAIRLGLTPEQIPRGIFIGILGSLILIPITVACTLLTELVYEHFGIDHPTSHELLQIFGKSEERGLRAMVLLSAIGVAPVFEEIFFRGHVQTLLVISIGRLTSHPAMARWIAIILASSLFALVHAPWMIPPIFILSIGLGYAYERTGNLWIAITMHTIFNALNVLAFQYLSAPN